MASKNARRADVVQMKIISRVSKQSMKILYDGFIYKIQAAGGINRYLSNIIDCLPADWMPLLMVWDTRQINFPKHPQLALKSFPAPNLCPGRLVEWGAKRYFAHL